MNKAFILPAESNGHAAITNQTPHAGGGDGAQTRNAIPTAKSAPSANVPGRWGFFYFPFYFFPVLFQ